MTRQAEMKLQIEEGDDQAFAAAREWLLERFHHWLPPEDAHLAADAWRTSPSPS